VAEMAYQQGDKHVLDRCRNIMNTYKREYIETNREHEDRIQAYLKVLNYNLAEDIV
jgi:hypothetical protein